MKPLRPGARVAVVAPGGLFDRAKVKAGMAWLRSLGLEPVPSRNLHAKDLIFAGTIEQRAADIRAALEDETIEALWCARGGYGAYAVAQALAAIAPSRAAKPLIGHSDVTALHLLWNRWGWASVHASCMDRLGDEKASAQERRLLEPLLLRGLVPPLGVDAPPGQLLGGNLSLLAASLGSRWELEARGKVLFIEEVGERAYRIDRMLTQLRSAGKLEGLRGVLLGDFTDCGEPDGKKFWPQILQRHFDGAAYPVVKGVRAGHGDKRIPLPFGV